VTEAKFERLYAEVLGRHAELKAQLEDPAFVAWLLERLLADKPDLRLLARHIGEQVRAEAIKEVDA
jgi:hypothetical protein